ncbi:MAG: SDR family oxidoreductase [Anaerolineae bacterium]|nr:SDR family oxidoreductase [Anaerolineae bacterium]
MSQWTTKNIPNQQGRLAVVTGTGGLGYEVALALARAGADVIIAGRNPAKGAEAVNKICAENPGANVRFEVLDLSELASIEAFGKRMQDTHKRLDLLINNAGVMTPPDRRVTADGFELQFGTNYLGHFALTAQLLPLLRKGQGARVVNVSSIAARDGTINFDDLQSEQTYTPMIAYGQSKLANLLFSFELQRRSAAANWGLSSIAAHPGISRTDLLHNGAGRTSRSGIVRSWLWFLFQPAAQGALPTLFAATSPDAKAGGYYGPNQLNETRGFPVAAKIPARAEDEMVAARLWEVSEQLTGLTVR